MNSIWLNAVKASAGAVPPYLAGGAPNPVAVYDPMGAASLAASYLRVAGTGGHANLDPAVVGSGIAPTHAPGTGWGFDGTQYLTTGIVPANDQSWVMLCRFSDFVVGGTQNLVGMSNGSGRIFSIYANFGGSVRYGNGGFLSISPFLTSGVLAVAGDKGYRNGSIETGSISAWTSTALRDIYIGAINLGTPQTFFIGNIQYVIIWNTNVGHATWVPAVSAAVAAL